MKKWKIALFVLATCILTACGGKEQAGKNNIGEQMEINEMTQDAMAEGNGVNEESTQEKTDLDLLMEMEGIARYKKAKELFSAESSHVSDNPERCVTLLKVMAHYKIPSKEGDRYSQEVRQELKSKLDEIMSKCNGAYAILYPNKDGEDDWTKFFVQIFDDKDRIVYRNLIYGYESEESRNDGTTVVTSSVRDVYYHYDENGIWNSTDYLVVTRKDESKTFTDQMEFELIYDADGRLTEVKKSGNTFRKFEYQTDGSLIKVLGYQLYKNIDYKNDGELHSHGDGKVTYNYTTNLEEIWNYPYNAEGNLDWNVYEDFLPMHVVGSYFEYISKTCWNICGKDTHIELSEDSTPFLGTEQLGENLPYAIDEVRWGFTKDASHYGRTIYNMLGGINLAWNHIWEHEGKLPSHSLPEYGLRLYTYDKDHKLTDRSEISFVADVLDYGDGFIEYGAVNIDYNEDGSFNEFNGADNYVALYYNLPVE